MKGIQVTKIVKEIKFEGFWGEKNLIFDFQEIFATINKMLFWQEDWALGYPSMKFRHFPDISQFPKVLSLKLFGNSWRTRIHHFCK